MKKLFPVLFSLIFTACLGSNSDETEPSVNETEKSMEEILEQFEADQGIEAEALAKGNASICDKIEYQNQKYSCRYNIVANQAIQAKDPDLCEAIGEETFIKSCRDITNIEE